MQTTLLGLAIAIILALLAALVGPLLIDLGNYRSLFEAEAHRLTGVNIRVTGKSTRDCFRRPVSHCMTSQSVTAMTRSVSVRSTSNSPWLVDARGMARHGDAACGATSESGRTLRATCTRRASQFRSGPTTFR